MNTGLLVAIIVIVVIVLALAWVLMRRRRTRRLQEQFGPEYERAVNQTGNRQAAEAELEDRRARRGRLEIVALDPAARERHVEQWRLVQAQFVDSPTAATRAADRLINEVMRERGYPVEDFEQRAADISVDHPQVVDDYRAAHRVAEANERSEASTEELRQALVHYRSLFEDLLETHGAAAIGLHHETAAARDREDPATTGTAAANGDAAVEREQDAHDASVREQDAHDASVREQEGGATDVRPPAASTPQERRTTEEAR